MEQHIKELFLIGIVVLLTGAGYLLLRNTLLTPSQKWERILTGFLGGFLILGGSAKFFEPFTTMFASQIALSGLPFPPLSNWAGQFGELTAGGTLLLLLVFWRRFPAEIAHGVFYLSHLLIAVIMLVAVYVHLHPDVPAEVLPLQSKPPVLTLIILLLAGVNSFLHRKSQVQFFS